MMKKITTSIATLALGLGLALSFSACGGVENAEENLNAVDQSEITARECEGLNEQQCLANSGTRNQPGPCFAEYGYTDGPPIGAPCTVRGCPGGSVKVFIACHDLLTARDDNDDPIRR